MLEGGGLLAAYAVTSFIAAITPGPAVFYIASHALSGSRKALAGAIIGMNLTNALWYVLVGTGLIALFHHFPTLFMVMRVAGIAYLLWLSVETWRHPAHGAQAQRKKAKGFFASFAGGVAMQASNPKALVYFTIFLPPFLDIERPVALQLLHLAMVGIGIEVIVLITYGMLIEKFGRSSMSAHSGRWIARISGAILIVIAGAMALSLLA
ncbi:MAG: LysE family translocator [Sphingobium sp.]|nr:LysE family translocator [Sphingobium sp.]